MLWLHVTECDPPRTCAIMEAIGVCLPRMRRDPECHSVLQRAAMTAPIASFGIPGGCGFINGLFGSLGVRQVVRFLLDSSPKFQFPQKGPQGKKIWIDQNMAPSLSQWAAPEPPPHTRPQVREPTRVFLRTSEEGDPVVRWRWRVERGSEG